VEIAKIDDQVGRHAVDGAVQLLRPIAPGAEVAPLRAGDRGDVPDKVDKVTEVTSADSLVSGASHKCAKWLARGYTAHRSVSWVAPPTAMRSLHQMSPSEVSVGHRLNDELDRYGAHHKLDQRSPFEEEQSGNNSDFEACRQLKMRRHVHPD
jgi:hypothetical protein